MALSKGTQLGPYEILGPIGAGGMGEVYLAHDSRLRRDVAIKIGAEEFSERFEREARAVAALNHPNICTLHDVGPNYLVMEYVEGVSPKGPMPLDEALRIAKQIAEALEAAHEKGIVHRDLKPGNIKLRPDGTVKVLDFGLAKIAGAPAALTEDSPTRTNAATYAGVILGTAAYMSPEQARGKPVDKRTDIWAFGVVLYELITGEQLFKGEDLTETLASVVKEQPNLDAVPARVRPLLQRCLEKDPKRRLRDIADAWLLLDEGTEAGTALPGKSSWQLALGWVLAAALATTLVVLSWVSWRTPSQSVAVMRLPIAGGLGGVLSPDGTKSVYAATDNNRTTLWVRSLESFESRQLVTEQTVQGDIFWSWDSHSVLFGAYGQIKRIDVVGGAVETLCDLGKFLGPRGGAQNKDGVILFGTAAGLMRLSVPDCAMNLVTKVDAGRQELDHVRPWFLPDGNHFVYLRQDLDRNVRIFAGALDRSPETQPSAPVATGVSGARVMYLPSTGTGGGYLLFMRQNKLTAQRFDLGTLAVQGEPIVLEDSVARYDATETLLLYESAATSSSQLTWFDRSGKPLGKIGEAGRYNELNGSPDGTRLALTRGIASAFNEIWVQEFDRGTEVKLTGDGLQPVWSPNNTEIVFSRRRINADSGSAVLSLFRSSASGGGSEKLLMDAVGYAQDWSPDGKYLLYVITRGESAEPDLWILPMEAAPDPGTAKPFPFAATKARENQGQFSPNGRWIAYTSDESGKREVHVRPFPVTTDGRLVISNGGGTQPRWNPNGKELLYFAPDGTLMSVELADISVNGRATLKPGIPKALFKVPITRGAGTEFWGEGWDIAPDGRFLINVIEQAERRSSMAVLNWQEMLKK